ncbi:MAG: hypothetical protein ACPL1K_07525, partial [Candidatus Kryptoniota bacterium]
MRAIHYYTWLSRLVEHIDSKTFNNPEIFMKISKTMIYAAESALSVLGEISREALVPPSLKLMTDGYQMNYLIDRVYIHGGLKLPHRHIFASRIGLQGLTLIILGVADLFVFQNTEFDVEVPLPEAIITKTINVGMAFCRIAEGVSDLALSVGRLFFKMGARASNYLVAVSTIFGISACIFSIVMIMLDIHNQYAVWKPVLENLLNPDIALSIAELAFTIATITAWLLGIPISGWIVFGAIIIVTIARIIWDYLKNYWAEVDYAKEFVSQVADKVMSVRNILKHFNIDDLKHSAAVSYKVHLLASRLAEDVSGKIKDDLNWANQYFYGLSEAQLNLAEAISPLE